MLHSNMSRAEMVLMIAEFKVASYKLMSVCPACGNALKYDQALKAAIFCCDESRKGVLHMLRLSMAKDAATVAESVTEGEV